MTDDAAGNEKAKRMTATIVANASLQPFVDDALAYPRAIPARVRAMLDGGVVEHDGGFFFASAYRPLDLSTSALERFTNTVRLDTLRPVQRIAAGTDAWVYECVAIGIAIGTAVLELAPTMSVLVRIDLGDVEYPDATFGFGATVDDSASADVEQGVLVMRV